MNMEKALDLAITRSQEYLFSKQKPEGYWIEEVEADTELSCEYIYLMHMFDDIDEPLQQKICNYILASQKNDGSWPLHRSGAGNLSTTIESYVALKLTGNDPEAEHMQRARDFILTHGGLSQARVFTKIHLALMGLYSWEGTPCLPVWFVLLPPWFKFNIYEMASWARSCVVPLCVVLHHKKEFPPRNIVDLDELYVEGRENVDHSYHYQPGDGLGNFFVFADRVLKKMERRRMIPFAGRALNYAERWILEHQDDPGDWGGIIPAMLYSVISLHVAGYSLDDPVIKKGLEAIKRLGIEDGDQWRLQPCNSAVWDTALTTWAMHESDAPQDDGRLRKAAEWMLPRQIRRYGDWAVKNRTGRPGGWCFEFDNDFYPDNDDTAAVILALNGVRMDEKESEKKATMEKGREWILSMQCQGGGWSAFDLDNNLHLMNKIPFADHGAMLDPTTVDISGKILEMLGNFGYKKDSEPVHRCIEFIRSEQESDGCWYGRWGVNYIYGTCGVLGGLQKVGEDMQAPYVRRAVKWLEEHRNPDGGWGESPDSYVDKSLRGRGVSTSSQTAWALLGLMSADETESDPIRRGIQYLLDRQEENGEWIEEEHTGTGFPGHYYLRYHGYRNCFPLMALGRYRRFIKNKKR